MATAVQIELRVDEKGAVQGIRAFDTSVKGSAGSVRQLNSELQAVGPRAAAAGRQGKAGLDQVGKSALTSREQVRLLSEELGVRIPRAMQSVLAKAPAVATALRGISGAMIGFGAVQIGGMVFEQLYEGAKKLWEEHLSLTKAAQDYNAELKKARDENFGDSHSIETTRMRIDQASDAAVNFRKQAEAAQKSTIGWRNAFDALLPGVGSGWQALHQRSQAHDLTQQQYEQQAQADKLTHGREEEQYHQRQVGNIDEAHAGDGALRGHQKYNAELQKTIQLDAEERRSANETDRIYGNPVAPNAGKAEQDQKDHIARLQMQAEEANEARENAQELRRVHEEALESGLRGSALYHAQEAAAIADLKEKGIASAQAVADIRLKFHNEEMKQLQETNLEVQKMHRDTLLGGMTGSARVRQEGQNRIDDVNASTTLNPGQRLAEIHDIDTQVQQQLRELNTNFASRVDEIIAEGADKQLQGFARIRADAENQIRQLQEQFDKQGGDPKKLAQGIAGIHSNADQDSAELARHNADETAQIEMEARAHSMSAEKNQTAAIKSELDRRLAQYQEEKDKQGLSDGDYLRRVAAAHEEANAQMVEAAKAAREKMAGEFSQFFKNPMEALKSLGDKAAGEAAASLVQRVQNHFGGGQGAQGAPGGGLLDSVFAKISGAPKGSSAHTAEIQGRSTAAPSMLSLSTAQIHIGSASIAFGGATSAAGGATGSSLSRGIRYSGGTYSGGSGSSSGASAFSGSGSTYEMGTGAISGSGGTRAAGSDAGFGGISSAGGAGDMGYSSTGTTGIMGGPGAAIPQSNTLNNAINNVGQGISFGKKALSTFGGGGKGEGDDSSSSGLATTSSGSGDPDSIPLQQMQNMPLSGLAKNQPQNPGMLGGGGIGANISGAASGALGLYAAVQGNGGVGGALSGAMSGMQLGMALGGPLGAAGGAVLGSLGLGGKEKARVYDLRTVRPGIKNETQGYETGSVDYSTAYSDMETLDTTAERTTKQWGPAAHSYYNDTIRNEIHQAEGKFTAMEKSGRSQFTASAAQYAVGTDSVPHDGMAMIHANERILPSDQNQRITRAMESLSSPDAVARGYRSAMRSSSARQSSANTGWTGDLHVHAIDAKSSAQWLMNNKHVIRGALNQSYAENSGGADAGY